jgi:hypothetical protein
MDDTPTTLVAQPFEASGATTGGVADQDSPATINQSDDDPVTSATIDASDLSGFPASGSFWVYLTASSAWVLVNYTGKSGDTFTGCTTTGTGTLNINDPIIGVRVITFADGWYIHRLAPSANSGTSDEDPKEFGAYAQTILRGAHSRYTVKWRQSGLYRISTTSTGTVHITLPATIAAELGIASTTLTLTSGTPVNATFPPSHVILSHYVPAESDSHIQTHPAFRAVSRMRSGRVDALSGGDVSADRAFSIATHPRTPADALEFGTVITPIQADDNDHARLNSPTADMDTAPGLWTVHRQVHTGFGLQMAYSFGRFQDLTADSPTITYFDYGYWTEQVSKSKVATHNGGWIQRVDRTGLELTRLGTSGTIT